MVPYGNPLSENVTEYITSENVTVTADEAPLTLNENEEVDVDDTSNILSDVAIV
jgi:hypothetical protein